MELEYNIYQMLSNESMTPQEGLYLPSTVSFYGGDRSTKFSHPNSQENKQADYTRGTEKHQERNEKRHTSTGGKAVDLVKDITSIFNPFSW